MPSRGTAFRALLVAVALALGLLWAWLSIVGGHDAPASGGVPEAGTASPPAIAPAAPATLMPSPRAGRGPRGGEAEAPADVPIPADACVVEGVLLGPDGKPVAGAAAQALVAEDTPSTGARTFGEGVVGAADGKFRLPVVGNGPALLVAGARGYRPATLAVTLVPGKRLDTGTLRLERGAVLAGRVRCGGVSKEKITVIATWYGTKKEGTRPAQDGFLWVEDGRAMWSQVETHPDDEGRFSIEGLEAGPYRLRVPAEDWGAPLHPDAYAQVDFLAHAPDERIDVDADRALFTFEVTSPEGIDGESALTLDGRDSIRLWTDTNGKAAVVLRPGARHRVTVEAEGFAPASLEITAGEAGGHRQARAALDRLPPGVPPTTPRRFITGVLLNGEWKRGMSCDALGPDGVPVALRARLLDASGTEIPCRFVDRREDVEVVSTLRTGISEPTMIFADRVRQEDDDWSLELGGQDYAVQRARWGSERNHLVVVLRTR